MSGVPRRQISELTTRYQLNPGFKDIYVEGVEDARLIRWFLQSCHRRDVSVYPVESVDVPADRVLGLHLADNNRGRVIRLSLDLDAALPETANSVLCIADRNGGDLFGPVVDNRFLCFTESSCIEASLLTAAVMGRILLGVRCDDADAEDVLTACRTILQESFVLHAANDSLGWGLKDHPVARRCAVKRRCAIFDRAAYIRDYLGAGGRLEELDVLAFEERVGELRKAAEASGRVLMRGHEITDFLAWYVREVLGRSANEREIRQLLFASAEISALGSVAPFSRILSQFPV